ncbi:MAG: SpoIIE family protein phosphatase [Ignavibacteriae bacterium]|nr:SpoIIE family protein phosphatase [Ignavibacteriota bacterium]
MEQSFIRKYGLIIALGILGAISFSLLYDDVSPRASIDLRHTRDEIMTLARQYLLGLRYDLKDYQQDAWLAFDGNTHLYLQSKGGVKEANAIIRADSLSTHSWEVSWYDRKVPRSQAVESYTTWLTPAGRILGFNHVINDSAAKVSLTGEGALTKAAAFLAQQGMNLSMYRLKTSQQTLQPNRMDHRFVWEKIDTTMRDEIWLRIQGDEVGGFRSDLTPTGKFQQQYSQTNTTATFLVTGSFAAVFLLFFFIVVLFLKKYHEGEVGTKTGLMVFIGLLSVAILSVVNQYSTLGSSAQFGDLNKFNVRIVIFVFNIFIVQVFLSVMVFAAWSVGESSSRSQWPAKIAAVDSMLFRRFFTLDVGESLVRGYAWGLTLIGGYALLLYWLIQTFDLRVYVQETRGVPESYLTGFHPVLEAIWGAVFAEIVFRLFFTSYLKEKAKKTWIGVLVSTGVWMLPAFTMWDMPFGYLSFEYTFVALAVWGLILSWLFLRYDLLTAITANFVIIALNVAIPIFSSTGAEFHTSMWIFVGCMIVPILLAIGGLMRRERFEFTPQTLPSHILRITQRERMAKELEIARKVQMSLLPKMNPIVDGYDIAGICIPAQEVGGDYYDFVNLGGKRIGIAIGDVSGKGVPAAIYMTLTKGILQSHAEENISPKRVLSKVNSLMYRTIDRNSFVSMFYAILDLEERKIRFSRAGQCPVILAQRSGEQGSFLTPKGMALGLEMGKIFDSVLEEQELNLQRGEVLVFYTDGFTEAMNPSREEFGEQRLVDAIARHRNKSARDIIQNICSEVQDYIAERPQHDDMTMVVVKVG